MQKPGCSCGVIRLQVWCTLLLEPIHTTETVTWAVAPRQSRLNKYLVHLILNPFLASLCPRL